MGFPFSPATWNVVEGAMYMGANGIAPGIYTFLAFVLCGVVLYIGNKSEKQRYKDYDKS